MGMYYFVVNTSKREFFDPGCLASDSKWDGLLYGISGEALSVLLMDVRGEVEGRWAGDSLYVLADESSAGVLHEVERGLPPGRNSALDILETRYTDITPLLFDHLRQKPEFADKLHPDDLW